MPTERSQEHEIVDFVEKCARYGVTRLIPSFLRPDVFPRFPDFKKDPYQGPMKTVKDFYSDWNPLKIMVGAAHQRGIEVHPYLALFANGGGGGIAWSMDFVKPGLDSPEGQEILKHHKPIRAKLSNTVNISKFANDHREYWKRNKEGKDTFQVTGGFFLSPSFPEARNYEASVFIDALVESGADGVQLEFVLERMDEKGVIIYGYEEPAIKEFGQNHGKDPRELPNDDPDWMQFRADYTTTFIRELNAKLKENNPKAALTATIIAGEMDEYVKVFQDWPAWIEQGLIDELFLWYRTTTDVDAVQRQTRAAADVIRGRKPLTAEFSCYHPGSFQDTDLLLEAARRAKANGADRLGVYRSHAVEQLGFWPVVQRVSRIE